MTNLKVRDKVRHRENPESVVCEVLEVKDMGQGEGYERVKIRLPSQYLGLTRYYASCELSKVE